MALIPILVFIVIALVLFYIAKIIIGSLGLPANIVQIIYLVMGLIAFLWLLQLIGVYTFPIR